MSRPERSLLDSLVDARLEALLDEDWEHYRRLGERILDYLDERNRLKGTGTNEQPDTNH